MTLTQQYFVQYKAPLVKPLKYVFMPDDRNFESRSGHRIDGVIVGKELRRWGVHCVEVYMVRFNPYLMHDIFLPFCVDDGMELHDYPNYKLVF